MPREKRAVAVSGFQVQVSSLRLLGTSLYPLWDSVLVAGYFTNLSQTLLGGDVGEDRLLRDRVHMSVCSFFCVFGFFYMLAVFRPVRGAEEGVGGI